MVSWPFRKHSKTSWCCNQPECLKEEKKTSNKDELKKPVFVIAKVWWFHDFREKMRKYRNVGWSLNWCTSSCLSWLRKLRKSTKHGAEKWTILEKNVRKYKNFPTNLSNFSNQWQWLWLWTWSNDIQITVYNPRNFRFFLQFFSLMKMHFQSVSLLYLENYPN